MFNPITLDQFTTASAQKQFLTAQDHFKRNPVKFVGEGENVFPVRVSPFESYVPLGALLDADANTETQFDINPSKVLGIISDKTTGFIMVGELLKPITVAFDPDTYNPDAEDNEFEIEGGRHRATAIRTILDWSGITDYNGLYIRVNSEYKNKYGVEADNGSRSMSATEKMQLKAQRLDIDVSDIGELTRAASEGLITPAEAFKLAFIQFHREESEGEETSFTERQPHTVGELGSKTYTAYAKRAKANKFHKTQIKQAQYLELVAYAAVTNAVPVLDKAESSNIARSIGQIASDLADATYDAVYKQFEAQQQREAAEQAERERVDRERNEAILAKHPEGIEQPTETAPKAKKSRAKADAVKATTTAKRTRKSNPESIGK